MTLTNTQFALLVVTVLVGFAIYVAWPYRHRLLGRFSRREEGEGSAINTSFWLALITAILVSIILGLPAVDWLTSFLPYKTPFAINLGITFTIAALYMVWVSHNTPTAYRSAMLAFGSYPIRVGPQRKGFVNGLNATPLGWPFFTLVNQFEGEVTIPFVQMQAFSSDLIEATIDGTYNRFMYDIYRTFPIENPDEAVGSKVLSDIRAATEDFTAEQLISQEAGVVTSTKVLLGRKAYSLSRVLLTADYDWGYDIKTIQINHIDLAPDYKAALRKRQQEVIEGEYEKTQVARRIEQTRALIAAGVNPDLAVTSAQVEVEKPGAKVHTINIPGLQGVGEGFGRLSEILRDYITERGR